MLYSITNYLFSLWDYLFQQENGIKQIYLVGNQGRRILTVDELSNPYDHVEIEFIFNEKTYIHIFPAFQPIHDPHDGPCR